MYLFIFLFIYSLIRSSGADRWSLEIPAASGCIVHQPRTLEGRFVAIYGWELVREIEVIGEMHPSATLSTTNPIWNDMGLNPGHSNRKPAINRHIYAMVLHL
jgi:hypothetical protein